MRDGIAAEKSPQPDDVGQRVGADQDRDQRAHDLLAEHGLRDQQRAQVLRSDEQRFDVADGDPVHVRAFARQRRDLARESTSAELCNQPVMPMSVAAGEADHAREHEERSRRRLARLEQPLAAPVAPRRAKAPHALDLRGVEHREHLRPPRVERRRMQDLSHSAPSPLRRRSTSSRFRRARAR